jgi:hypothetical protein
VTGAHRQLLTNTKQLFLANGREIRLRWLNLTEWNGTADLIQKPMWSGAERRRGGVLFCSTSRMPLVTLQGNHSEEKTPQSFHVAVPTQWQQKLASPTQ